MEITPWLVLGLIAGGFLMQKYSIAIGIERPDEGPLDQELVRVFMLLGPFAMFTWIGYQLSQEARREKITWATYWTTTFGIATATFTLLGIAGIGDIFNT